jgi:hypothetical protein
MGEEKGFYSGMDLAEVSRMPNAQLDQFLHSLMGTVVIVMLLCAAGVLLIGLPLTWLRIKMERKLIDVIRSWRARRAVGNGGRGTKAPSTFHVAGLEDSPHCPVCNSVMVRRTPQRGANAGNNFWGCPKYPDCRGHAFIDYGATGVGDLKFVNWKVERLRFSDEATAREIRTAEELLPGSRARFRDSSS